MADLRSQSDGNAKLRYSPSAVPPSREWQDIDGEIQPPGGQSDGWLARWLECPPA